jgi:molecular chaperone GrpE (heat shock protein)
MDAIEQVRSRAAEALKAEAHAHRDAERARAECAGELARLALAAVEGLETLSDALSGLRGELPDPLRTTLDHSARAAWERLEAAGLKLDGRVGETVDLARHRVLKAVAGREPGTVASVVTPGVTFQGRRIREAVVWVTGGSGGGEEPVRYGPAAPPGTHGRHPKGGGRA